MVTSKTMISPIEFNLLRDYIQKETGMIIGDDKIFQIESRLSPLVLETGCSSFKEFYLKVKNDSSRKLKDVMIEVITTNETMWFRDLKQWDFIKNSLLPKYINEIRRGIKERVIIWSVIASTGQEPYSFAMLIDEALQKEPKVSKDSFYILATNISSSSIFFAISGRYNENAMAKGMQPGYPEKYFKKSDGITEIDVSIKDMVSFRPLNIIDNFEELPEFDIILCKNIKNYLHDDLKKKIYEVIYEKINKNGILFIGATEKISEYANKFEKHEQEKFTYYSPLK